MNSIPGLFKKCPDCKLLKPVSDFSRNSSRPDGLQFYCKECFSRRAAHGYRVRQQAKGRVVRERVVAGPGHKYCPDCKQVKPHSEWHRNAGSRDGYSSYCRGCRAARGRRDYIRRQYAKNEAELTALKDKRFGKCWICLVKDAVHIDHDHVTGEIRGALCANCNLALGLFHDRVDVLAAAIDYLGGVKWRKFLEAPGVYRVLSSPLG